MRRGQLMDDSTTAGNELTRLSAVELARRIACGDVSAVEALSAYTARIERLNPRLNAIIAPRFDEARSEAQAVDDARRRGETLGPLAGVPLTIKDCFDLRGTATTIGVGRRRGEIATTEGPVVRRLRRAGAVIVGKTNVPQIMLQFETDNRAFGRTPHPENPERGAGGSSGGEAAAIAARLSALGLGTDLLGSVRQPAHACGVHGFKPTTQRASLIGTMNTMRGMEAIISQPGPMARSMNDVVAASGVLFAEPYDDPYAVSMPWRDPAAVDVAGLRVGVWEDDPSFRPSPAVRRAVAEAAEALRSRGADVVPFTPPDAESSLRLCVGLLASAAGRNVEKALQGEKPMPGVARMLRLWGLRSATRSVLAAAYDRFGQTWQAKFVRWCRSRDAGGYWELVYERRLFVRRVFEAWQAARLDAVISPPHGLPALRHGASSDTIVAAVYAFLFSLLGVPCGTVAATRVRAEEETERPASHELVAATSRRVELGSAGLPVGVQVAALPWRDDVCLAAMQALESHFAGRPDYPPAADGH